MPYTLEDFLNKRNEFHLRFAMTSFPHYANIAYVATISHVDIQQADCTPELTGKAIRALMVYRQNSGFTNQSRNWIPIGYGTSPQLATENLLEVLNKGPTNQRRYEAFIWYGSDVFSRILTSKGIDQGTVLAMEKLRYPTDDQLDYVSDIGTEFERLHDLCIGI